MDGKAHVRNEQLQAQPTDPAPRRRGRRFVFRVLAVLFPVAVTGAIEFGLRLNGSGVDTALVTTNERVPDGRQFLNPRVDYAYCAVDLRGPEPRLFTSSKPRNTLRIVVIGDSTAQGYPYPSELSFPRQLELILGLQFPERNVEVLNAAIIGLSTLPLVDVTRQVFAAEPDVIVVYAGHNEFYGVGGVATNAELSDIELRLRKLRTIQLVSQRSELAASSGDDLITRLPTDVRIAQRDVRIAKAEQQFRRHLLSICDLCSDHDTPVVLCTAASNLRAQSPIRVQTVLNDPSLPEVLAHPPSPTDDLVSMRTRLAGACERDPENACLWYRLAQVEELLNDFDAARQHYTRARDYDECRYRAPSAFQAAVHDMANEVEGVVCCDVAGRFFHEADRGIPGADLFVEHVHFTSAGHWLAARTIAQSVVNDVLIENWNEALVPAADERDRGLGVIPEDEAVAWSLAWFVGQSPPFDEALDAELHRDAISRRLIQLGDAMSPEAVERFRGLDPQTKMDELVDGLGRTFLESRDFESALTYFEKSKRRRPWMPSGYVFAAVCCTELGRLEEARSLLADAQMTPIGETPALRNVRRRLVDRLERAQLAGNGN